MGSAVTIDSGEFSTEVHRAGRTALVLSAGGLFGAYQAGVWSLLQDMIQPDIVVGASIGSLNGWLIAGGVRASDLERRWLSLEAASKPQWRVPKQLADGILDSTLVEGWIQEVYAQSSPSIRYGVVATELRTMKPTLFEWPDLTWQHLAASCGVPVFLRQHRINGVLYADGGLVDPIPLWAAMRMGATSIVSINVMKNRPLIFRAVAHAARMYSRHCPHQDERVKVVEISPSEILGTVHDSMCWSRENAERWIALGQQDAYAIKHLVVECFERV
jgi:predicted acylesterase/phospholipase RssA